PFNDPEALEEAVTEEVAAVIMEPVIGNAGCILPKEDYLEQVREVTEEKGTMLIFDEVITGYRLGLGGAQGYYGVKPDITTLGKILGGGLPIGAIAAGREVMGHLSPLGPVYQAGTFNGNPLSMAAGLAALGELEDGSVYKRLETLAKSLREGLQEMAQNLGFKTRTYGVASMFQIYFTQGEVSDYRTALRADRELFLRFQKGLLAKGIFLPPSQYECNFLSSAHGQGEVASTLEAAEEVLRGLRR
ncbi:MAG: aminotransferase class III-fold pyridoxal phosphate-dependent enzyme, partial [Candidatus Hydrothermarchaeota archaeon]